MAKTTKKNKVRVDAEGQAHIQASFNNIIISLTNKNGQVISWSSENIFYFNRVKYERVNQLPIMPSIGASITF